MLGKGQLSECYSKKCSRGSDYENVSGEYKKTKGKLVCARNWSSVGRGSYFNAHTIQTIGFQPTSYPKETCASQVVTGDTKESYPSSFSTPTL
jgi:hypothetical protein